MININDWSDAPDWAVYKACDKNGDWFYYETKPFIDTTDAEWVSLDGMLFIGSFERPIDFKSTLLHRHQLEIPYDN